MVRRARVRGTGKRGGGVLGEERMVRRGEGCMVRKRKGCTIRQTECVAKAVRGEP